MIIHVGDQGFPNRVRHFEQDVTVAISLDQLPDRQTLFQWQGFKNVGDVGGVQIIELALQLNEILPVDQVLDPVMMRTFLAMRQVFDDPLALQQLNNLSEAILKAFLRFFTSTWVIGELHSQQWSTPEGSISQFMIGKTKY
nr:hypothetical protein GCM10020185_54470 [Pseudomonas brassicacearum subsp. brassicacearum]